MQVLGIESGKLFERIIACYEGHVRNIHERLYDMKNTHVLMVNGPCPSLQAVIREFFPFSIHGACLALYMKYA